MTKFRRIFNFVDDAFASGVVIVIMIGGVAGGDDFY